MKKTFFILFAISGFLFAILVHLYIYAELAANRPGEKIHAVVNMSETMLVTNQATNGIVSISESNATKFMQVAHDAVEARDRQVASLFHIVSCASVLIFILSICVLNASKKI
jgi:beta-glucosidase/6-phospho-beta-glucosidase/beta-galactosidase